MVFPWQSSAVVIWGTRLRDDWYRRLIGADPVLDEHRRWVPSHRVHDQWHPPRQHPEDVHVALDRGATGYRPGHSWLDVPVYDHKGRIRHDGGVVRDAPGMYLLGANVLRRRRSSYIHGAEQDTADLAAHLHGYLDTRAAFPRLHLARPSVSA